MKVARLLVGTSCRTGYGLGLRSLAAVAGGTLVVTLAQVPVADAVEAPAAKPTPTTIDLRPDRTSAMMTAVSQRARVEDLSARTPASSVFANPDGTWTLESYSGVVRSETEPDEWVEVDPSFKPRGGSVDGLEPIAVPFSVEYGDGGTKKIAEVTAQGGGALSVEWPTKLPEATVDANTVTFPSPGVAPGADEVVLTSSPEGFNFSVTLDRVPSEAAPEYRFPLSLDGVDGGRFVRHNNGTIEVLAKGEDGPMRVATITAPVMWDSADEPTIVPVDSALEGEGANRVLVLRPDPAYLANAERTYPVTVDPTVVLAASGDTWVQNLVPNTSQHASTELRVGTNSLGVNQSRSYLNFDTSSLGAITADSIAEARVVVSNFEAGACTGQAIRLSQITAAWTLTGLNWANQPAATGTGSSTNSTGRGATGCATEGTADFDATAIVKSWVNGSANYGVQLRADNAGSNGSWRKYRSMENGDSAKSPKLVVTINRRPGSASDVSPTPAGFGNYVRSLTPTLTSIVTDPDGGLVKGHFEVKQGATLVWSGSSAAVASGGRASVTVPSGKLAEGGTYMVHAYGEDDLGSRSATATTRTIVVDTVAPSVAISSTQFTHGTWRVAVPGSDTLTYTGSSDTGGFWVDYDGATVAAGANGSGSASFTYAPKAGWHVVRVTPVDRAGNYGVPAVLSYGAGAAAFTSPVQWAQSTSSFPVDLSGPASATGATLEWRRAGESAWRPVAEVAKADGTSWTGTVASSTGRSTTGKLIWYASSEMVGSVALEAPALVEMRGCFQYPGAADSCTSSRYLGLRTSGFGSRAPSTMAGPAQVSLGNGELGLTLTDVREPGFGTMLSIGRTYSSFSAVAEGAGRVFGPGWTADLQGPASGYAGAVLRDNTLSDGTLTISELGGTLTWVKALPVARRSGATLAAGAWVPADEETQISGVKLEVAGSGTSTSVLVTENSTVTKFVPATAVAGAPYEFVPSWVEEAGSTARTTYSTDGAGRVTRILSPAATGVSCPGAGTLPSGCHALELTYNQSAVDGNDHLSRVHIVHGASRRLVASYGYDSSGRLVQFTNERAGLSTTYAYNGSSTQLSSSTPAGLKAYRFEYDPNGRAKRVGRDKAVGSGTTDLAQIRYDVPVTGASSLPSLGLSDVAKWLQSESPATAVAVFRGDVGIPTAVNDITAEQWRRAEISYADNQGRQINTASYGAGRWLLTATQYDSMSNPVRELRPHEIAAIEDGELSPRDAGLIQVYGEVKNAAGQVTIPAGIVLTEEFELARRAIVNAAGDVQVVRPHRIYTYDQGAPNGGVDPSTQTGYGLVTSEELVPWSVETGADLAGAGVLRSERRSGYEPIVAGDASGWDVRMPTSESMMAAGVPKTVRQVRRNQDGRVVETRQPESDGTDAGARQTLYYAAGAGAEPLCSNKPQWAGLVCMTRFAGSGLPTERVTGYNADLQHISSEETVNGIVVRSVVSTYDAAGRLDTARSSVSGIPSSVSVRGTDYSYDSSTGLLVGIGAIDSSGAPVSGTTITTAYDSWGRPSSYEPAAGETTSWTYDGDGNVASISDPRGTTTYTYGGLDANGVVEGRDLVTKSSVTRPSAAPVEFHGAYDEQGSVVVQKLPGSITQRMTSDLAGNVTGLTYSGSSAVGETPWMSWSRQSDFMGRAVVDWTPAGAAFEGTLPGVAAAGYSRRYEYDFAGRIAEVEDHAASPGAGAVGQVGSSGTITPTVCETRVYTFDGNGNRTGKATRGSMPDGTCSTTTASSRTWQFDAADRPSTSGYELDALGRVLTVPSADGGGASATTLTYFDNDAVRSITRDGVTSTFDLDAAGRRKVESAGGGTVAHHYTDGSDVTTWSESTVGSTVEVTRYLSALQGGLAATLTSSGSSTSAPSVLELGLVDLQGDRVASVSVLSLVSVGIDRWSTYDEFGNSESGGAAATGTGLTYGWMGARQRQEAHGMVLMGSRVYNPATATFTSPDPVYGGNPTAYGYPNDPVNSSDPTGLSGTCSFAENDSDCKRVMNACKNGNMGNYLRCTDLFKLLRYLEKFSKEQGMHDNWHNAGRHFAFMVMSAIWRSVDVARAMGIAHEKSSDGGGDWEGADQLRDALNNSWSLSWYQKNRATALKVVGGRTDRAAARFFFTMGVNYFLNGLMYAVCYRRYLKSWVTTSGTC